MASRQLPTPHDQDTPPKKVQDACTLVSTTATNTDGNHKAPHQLVTPDASPTRDGIRPALEVELPLTLLPPPPFGYSITPSSPAKDTNNGARTTPDTLARATRLIVRLNTLVDMQRAKLSTLEKDKCRLQAKVEEQREMLYEEAAWKYVAWEMSRAVVVVMREMGGMDEEKEKEKEMEVHKFIKYLGVSIADVGKAKGNAEVLVRALRKME